MITLTHPRIETEIQLDREHLYEIVIESPVFLRKFLLSLERQICDDEPFLQAYEKGKPVLLSKKAVLVHSPLFFENDDKKITTAIQKDVISKIGDEAKTQFVDLMKKINEWLESVVINYDLPITYENDLEMSSFLKAFSLGSEEIRDSPVENVTSRIKRISLVGKRSIFFFLNARDFFTSEEIGFIFHELALSEVEMVLLSSHESGERMSFERKIIIDKDLAELNVGFETV